MIRLLYIISILACIVTGIVLVQVFRSKTVHDPALEQVYSLPDLAEKVKDLRIVKTGSNNNLSPLVIYAQAFSAMINPPLSVRRSDDPTVRQSDRPPMRPAVSSVIFKVQAISFYSGQPERSMALILESGSHDGMSRWIKKDSQVGSWVVQEVRRGMVIIRNGQQVREVALERSPIQRTLVKEVKPGSRVSFLQEAVIPSGSGGQE